MVPNGAIMGYSIIPDTLYIIGLIMGLIIGPLLEQLLIMFRRRAL